MSHSTVFTNATLVAGLDLPASILTDIATGDKETYVAASNTFLNSIVNKICMQKVEKMEAVDNPFLKFDGEPCEFGDTIENVGLQYIQGEVYDPNDTNPHAVKKPTVMAEYATVNYKMKYYITTYEKQLRQACLSQSGLVSIMDNIVEMLSTSKDGDIYQAQIAFLDRADIYADGIESVTQGADEIATAKIACKKIVDVVTDFQHPCADNNKMHFKLQHSSPKSTILVIKQSLKNSIDMNYLTGLFNLQKVDMPTEIITVRDFYVTAVDENSQPIAQGVDMDFAILDSRGFDNHSVLEDAESIRNPGNMSTNTFLHKWKIFGFKKWHNARAFKLVAA